MRCMVRDNLTTSARAPTLGPMAGPRQGIEWISDPAKQKNILETLRVRINFEKQNTHLSSPEGGSVD